MVQIFKTDVQTKELSEIIIKLLLEKYPTYQINFDLEDCDRILRVENKIVDVKGIIGLLASKNHRCEAL